MQRGVERPFFDTKHVGGYVLDVRRDGVAVHGAARVERLENQEEQRPLKNVVPISRHVWVGLI